MHHYVRRDVTMYDLIRVKRRKDNPTMVNPLSTCVNLGKRFIFTCLGCIHNTDCDYAQSKKYPCHAVA